MTCPPFGTQVSAPAAVISSARLPLHPFAQSLAAAWRAAASRGLWERSALPCPCAITWVDQQLERLWRLRGPAPGMAGGGGDSGGAASPPGGGGPVGGQE